MDPSSTEVPAPSTPESARRSFLTKVLAVVFGTITGVVPVFAGLLTALDPLRPRGKGGDAGPAFLKITTIDALPEGGGWRQFPVIADLQDAWTKTPNARVGAVYLKREGGSVKAISTICPHAGCFVSTKTDGSFKCPCHDSEFEADGKLRARNAEGRPTVSPRDLDTLEVKVENGQVLVQYVRYRTGSADKVPQS